MAFLFGCSQKPTLPPVPKAGKSFSPLALVSPAQPATNVWLVPIVYPPGIVTSNYWWDVMASTDSGKTWSVVVSNATGYVTVYSRKSDPPTIYRLRGR
jgi:hypothetical protein